VGTEVKINQKIQFKHNSAKVEPESKPILDAVGDILKKHPELQLVEVGGHASKEGDPKHNQKLTQQRVESVSKELTARGIEKTRLLSQGYGFYCLLDPGTTEESNEKNRRVEFKILLKDGKPTDQVDKRGCDEAVKAGIKPKALPDPNAKPADKKPADAKPAAEKKPAEAKGPAPKADAKPAAPKPEAKPAADAKAPALKAPAPAPAPAPEKKP
jgi:hypothetical protein